MTILRPVFPKALLLAIVVVTTLSARADDGARFFIETISIEGTRRASSDLLIAEARLKEGESYNEAQLSDAIARINRLPFVLHTDFRLEKGTEPGRYSLIITVSETRPLFVSYRSTQQFLDVPRDRGGPRPPPGTPPEPPSGREIEHTAIDRVTAGVRAFVGAKGVVTLAADYFGCGTDKGRCYNGFPRFSAGFTQYDLFGTKATASLLVQYKNGNLDLPDQFEGDTHYSFDDHLAYQFTASVPVAANDAVRFGYYVERNPLTWDADPSPDARLLAEQVHFDRAELSWIHDTTNDPLLPTRGTVIRATVEAFKIVRYTPADGVRPGREWVEEGRFSATRFTEISPRQSIFGEFAIFTMGNGSLDTSELRIGYAANLWGRDRVLRYGDLRFEAMLDRNFFDLRSDFSYSNASVGVALRNAWGIFRVGVQYTGWRDLR
jgi:hypothetical protein